MKSRTLTVAAVAVFLVSSMLVLPNAGAGDEGRVKWLFLLYLDADNSLDVSTGPHHESVVESDFDELMSVGSTDNVAAYALVDRIDGPAYLFKFNQGSMDEMTDYYLNGMEANMGDPETLRSFVAFTSTISPANHIMLIFWDHGSPRGVAWDDHTSDTGGTDFLSQWEVVEALSGYRWMSSAPTNATLGRWRSPTNMQWALRLTILLQPRLTQAGEGFRMTPSSESSQRSR